MYHFLTNSTQQLVTDFFLIFVIILIISICLGLYLLSKGGDLLSDNCGNLAKSFGVPSIVVGLTIVSIATSAPELFTSISAINSGATGLVLGNIIGSNIANIGLILGISLIICPIDSKNAISSNQRLIILILTFIFTGYLFFHPAHSLNLFAGSFLLSFIFIYLIFLTNNALKKKKVITEPDSENDIVPSIYGSLLMVLIATLTLWIGSDTLVFGAKNLASIAGIPDELIGFTLLAIGTSLPELAASISLVKKNEFEMLLGNILGSNLFNIGLVGGIAGIMGPITNSTKNPWIDYMSLIIMTSVFVLLASQRKMTKIHGSILLFLYLLATLLTWNFNS